MNDNEEELRVRDDNNLMLSRPETHQSEVILILFSAATL